MLVSNSEFIQKLEALFTSSSEKHSIYVTSKRAPPKALSSSSPTASQSDSSGGAQHGFSLPLLFKATNGASGTSRIKFRTLVSAADLPSFQASYLSSLRSSLSASLKKRDKAKERRAEKVRDAARKRVTAPDAQTGKERLVTNHVGSKRGAGRRKRQRALKKGVEIRKEARKEAKRKARSSRKPVGAGAGAARGDGDVVMADA
ncbi:uncharacterized protein PFL1_02926 [Pseudozyma flocculosa PF-1]|uniref:Signal recognition particle subunit SRP14 n=2 Tax=Pseudozyma flocculosa TaxID=84751 RepID=A0A5C3F1W4_9BASI|nr:uncharacterized protein PFL1_02926 [Pseudozyma flocculosa PF-1]EPQ29706.1 hypothetical protein PFL1_02926 [Pseudozyma flocculosa PF-1]SPO38282.1 related to Signal recognition particle 14 kDa protein [Pseudozyma flocculosa]